MNTRHYLSEIAERLSPDDGSEKFPALFVVVLRELATGHAVSPERLAKQLGWPAERVWRPYLKRRPASSMTSKDS